MKIEQQKVNDCRVKLIVNVSPEETQPEYEWLTKSYVRHGRIPGFRPGKAPKEVVLKHFEKEFNEDIRRNLVAKFHAEAIKQEKLNVANIVDIGSIIESPTTGISFVLELDLVPTFKLPKYRQIPVKVKPVIVEEAQVESQIDYFRDSMAQYEPSQEAAAEKDMVSIDYTAEVDGKPMNEVYETSGVYAAGENFWLQLGSNERIPTVSKALVGLKEDEDCLHEVKFPKDFHVKELRGAKAKYAIKVKAVRKANLPSDEDIVSRLGFESIEKLRELIQKNILKEAEQAENSRQKQEVADYLLKKCDFPLPDTVVAENSRMLLNKMLSSISEHPDARTYIQDNAKKIAEDAETSGRERTRLNYILLAIAAEEKLQVEESELSAEIEELTNHLLRQGEKNITPDKVRKELTDDGRIEGIREELLCNKTLNWLWNDAKK